MDGDAPCVPADGPGNARTASPTSGCTTSGGRGIDDVFGEVVRTLGSAPAFLSVDVDVLEPALLGPGGTGVPEPGGMSIPDLLDACRRIATEASLVGAEVVEVIPTANGSASLAALVATGSSARR